MVIIFERVEIKLEKFISITFVPLILLIVIGFALRLFFVPWDLPLSSPDSIFYLAKALTYANGSFDDFRYGFGWPMFLSAFFSFFDFSEYTGYLVIMRLVSITGSVATIPILYLVAKEYVKKYYALMAVVLFAIEPNLNENSPQIEK